MISLKSRNTIDAKSIPGVRFTVRTLNKIQRAKRDLTVIAVRQKMSQLVREYAPLQAIAEDERTPEQLARMREIDIEFSWLEASEIKPAEIRAALVSIEGLEIDGKPATADSLIDGAGADYDELIEEIDEACRAAAGLTPTEIKNSASGSTSAEQDQTSSSGSSATPAS